MRVGAIQYTSFPRRQMGRQCRRATPRARASNNYDDTGMGEAPIEKTIADVDARLSPGSFANMRIGTLEVTIPTSTRSIGDRVYVPRQKRRVLRLHFERERFDSP